MPLVARMMIVVRELEEAALLVTETLGIPVAFGRFCVVATWCGDFWCFN